MKLRTRKQLLMTPADLAPAREGWEVLGVFNPGAALLHEEVVLLARVAERPGEQRNGFTALPRFDAAGEPVLDWFENSDLEMIDPRVVRVKSQGRVRLTFLSYLRILYCGRGDAVREIGGPRLWPTGPLEEFGVEDPRITEFEGRYWITYVAVSSHGAATALASTTNFEEFQRHGIIFAPENKDVVLFPRRIGGMAAALHRPNGATRFTPPEMWFAQSEDLLHWGGHAPLYTGGGAWENERVGAGAPPVRVEQGWLEIYHGSRRTSAAHGVGEYQAAALLLDAENPARVVARGESPILAASEEFERRGFIPNVVFPTGLIDRGDTWQVYYGVCDTAIAVAEMEAAAVLANLRAAAA